MTLKDIAEKADVSMMTVSNVINGKHKRVSAKTIEKVNNIIAEYGYVPNLSARSLTNKTSNIIGIIIFTYGNSDTDYLDENPYLHIMLETIEVELRKNNYFTMIHSIVNKQDIIEFSKNWNVDGIIFLYPLPDDTLKALVAENICPIAVFDSRTELPEVITVCSDDFKGLYLSTKYLINHGHSHIAFVSDYEGNPLLTLRFNGYRHALEESGISFRPEYIFPFASTYKAGIAAGKQIASSNTEITAAVTTADVAAIGLMEGARLGGYRIPAQLSVTGYDDLSLCQYTSPKLTSVSQNIRQKALCATNLLIEKIQTGTVSQSPHAVLDVDIVERQSVLSLI